MKKSNWIIVNENKDSITIKDLGPWNKYSTVTNDAESVVEELAPVLGNRKLLCYDSEGLLGELLVKDGKFNGFAPGPK